MTIDHQRAMAAAINWVTGHTADLLTSYSVSISRGNVTVQADAGELAALVDKLGLVRIPWDDFDDFHVWSATQGTVLIRALESGHDGTPSVADAPAVAR